MAYAEITHWSRTLHLMNSGSSRNGLLTVISLMAVLEVIVVLAAMWNGDVTERVQGLLQTAFASIGGISAVLLFVLRFESVKATVESVDRKADTAALAAGKSELAATAAAQRTVVVEQKVEAVRHDIHNDVLVSKVLEALRKADEDPDLEERRIQRIAAGVQRDRHLKANKDARWPIRDQLERRGLVPRDNPEGMGGG